MAMLALLVVSLSMPQGAGAVPQEREAVTPAQLTAAIDKLGTVDYPVRMDAARTVRRAAPSMAVPALIRAVTEHADGYVRFRALVLLSGFNDPRTREVMVEAVSSPNDRLRAVAYNYFELNPDAPVIPRLLDALDREESEFVRPALTRALAASGGDPRVSQVMNGLVLKGHVDSIAGSTGSRMSLMPPENAVGNFVKVVQRIPVKIRIDEADAGKVVLRPGMNVEATVIVQ